MNNKPFKPQPRPPLPTTEQWSSFSAYERTIAQQVINGQTVVAAMHRLYALYATPFLQWVKTSGLGVCIDRPTIWANPYRVSAECIAARAVNLYAKRFKDLIDLPKEAPALKGKVLLCWCKKPDKHVKGGPEIQPCHGDVLAEYVNGINIMSKPITHWVNNIAVKALCAEYGAHWEQMDAEDATAILAVLAVTTNQLANNGGESDSLSDIASMLDLKLPAPLQGALLTLDEELDARKLLALIQGLVAQIPASVLEGE